MAVERAEGRASLIDVLDRVLDKGIVVDAWARVATDGIDLRRMQARVEVMDPLGATTEEAGGAQDDRPAPARGGPARP